MSRNNDMQLQRQGSLELAVSRDLKHLELAVQGRALAELMDAARQRDEFVDLGRIRFGQGDYEQALALFEKAVSLEPGADTGAGWLVRALIKMNRLDAARALTERLEREHPASDETFNARYFLREQAGDTHALQDLVCEHMLIKSSCTLHCKLAGLLLMQDNKNEAAPALADTFNLNPFCFCAKIQCLALRDHSPETRTAAGDPIALLHDLLRHFPIAIYKHEFLRTLDPLINQWHTRNRKAKKQWEQRHKDFPKRDGHLFFFKGEMARMDYRKLGWITQKMLQAFGTAEDHMLAHIAYRAAARDPYQDPDMNRNCLELSQIYLLKARQMEPGNPLLALYDAEAQPHG